VRRLTAALEHFHDQGWVRLPHAIDATSTAAMRDVIWSGLARDGIARDDPATWRLERPARLQRLRSDPAFLAVGNAAVIEAIDAILGRGTWPLPENWGSLFLAFPSRAAWQLPTMGWHIDSRYTSALEPVSGVKTFALLGDVAPRGGGTLIVGGSHRLVHGWFARHPPPPRARSAEMRRLLLGQPYLRDLQSPGDPAQRVERFMDRVEDHDGIALQIVEACGEAGDVFLLHPLTMHAASPNTGSAPRLMLSGGVTMDKWGWQGIESVTNSSAQSHGAFIDRPGKRV
jgi:hypothetical protein